MLTYQDFSTHFDFRLAKIQHGFALYPTLDTVDRDTPKARAIWALS